MIITETAINKDVALINRIEAVPTILDVVCRITGMGFAAVARVTENHWVACNVLDQIAFGLKPGGELKVETTICHEIRQNREAVIIDNVDEDENYVTHHTPAMYGFKSYISMPIILPDGCFFGTLCAIDPKPAVLKTPGVIGMFKMFAELIAFHLDALERMDSSEAKLLRERGDAELREQFIAVLGHDLRNPLGAIISGVSLLESMQLNERGTKITSLIKSCTNRMFELIDNILDFARGRLGSGLTLNLSSESIEPVINQVAAELRAIWPNREIELFCSLTETVYCDHARIAQLLSNLLGNALTYGSPADPVRVTAISSNSDFELSVTNSGEQIPAETIERLFQPFSRGEVKSHQQGLGLGLYIASEIARAHGGELSVTSNPEETRFTFQMQNQ